VTQISTEEFPSWGGAYAQCGLLFRFSMLVLA